jgi:hypothetical protein
MNNLVTVLTLHKSPETSYIRSFSGSMHAEITRAMINCTSIIWRINVRPSVSLLHPMWWMLYVWQLNWQPYDMHCTCTSDDLHFSRNWPVLFIKQPTVCRYETVTYKWYTSSQDCCLGFTSANKQLTLVKWTTAKCNSYNNLQVVPVSIHFQYIVVSLVLKQKLHSMFPKCSTHCTSD